MEGVEAFLDGEWESLSKLFSCEDSDIQLHFNGGNFFSSSGETPSSFAGVDGDLFLPSDNVNPNFYCASQESSNSSEIECSPFTSFHGENHQAAAVNGGNFLQDLVLDNNTFQSMDFCTLMNSRNDSSMVPVFPDDFMQEILQLKAQMCNPAVEIQPAENGEEMQIKRNALRSSEDNLSDQSPKKRPRVSRDAQRNKRNAQSRKNKKANISDEEANNGVGNGQSASTCSSEEEDSNGASQEMNGGATSESKGSGSTAKAKANKGPATDPQSLYARKRRERINERLRVLQNLVPNGTKVDISTMLEEAVQYVKFLQLQIKLLSSDDTWMYAPIAYNGMDMGLYQKINVPNPWPQN